MEKLENGIFWTKIKNQNSVIIISGFAKFK